MTKTRICKNCDKEFIFIRKDNIFCSKECGSAYWRKHNIKSLMDILPLVYEESKFTTIHAESRMNYE